MSLVAKISQYWNEDAVPGDVASLLATFPACNPDLDHEVFSEASAERLIGRHFGARELAAFQSCAVPSMQSDYLRYCAVHAHGGVYADVDYRCLKSLRPLIDDCDGGEIFLGPGSRPLNGQRVCMVWSGFFAFRRPGHPFIGLALEIATANLEARIAERVWPAGENIVKGIWLTVGPGIFTLMLLMRDMGSFDAFVRILAGSPAEPFAELYCEVVGSYERIVTACEGVRVSPYAEMAHWVGEPRSPLAYKETDVHWHNVKTAIFR